MNIFRSVLLCLCGLHFHGYAQLADSLHTLRRVEVSGSRLDSYSSGHKEARFDSLQLDRHSNSNLSDLLSAESQVFVKSYGAGSLATTSFRGAGAGHTALLWNGFNLQSPMNGLLDAALVPVCFLDNVRIRYGSEGALWGSGAVGGSIHLTNSALFNKGLSVFGDISAGSFSDQQQQAGIELSRPRFITSVKAFRHEAKNDFYFQNIAKYAFPVEKQTNAGIFQHGLLQENYFLINEKQKINTRFWYQFNDRRIPPSMTQNINLSRQYDEAYRLSSEWQRTGERLTIMVRSAYFNEFILYNDPLIALDSKSETKVWISEAEMRFSLSRHDVMNIGVNNTYSHALSADFLNDPEQDRIAAFASYKIHTPRRKWNAILSARQELVGGQAAPFVGSFGIEGEILRYFRLKANASQHYRIPTFNDLYWAQGGNPDLEAEKGWSTEAGIEHKADLDHAGWTASANAFSRNIQNWIIWLPDMNGNWSPDNVLEVWSRGVEYKGSVYYKSGRFRAALDVNYNYILSTNERTGQASFSSLHKQLIYVPIQNAHGAFSVSWRNSSITYTQAYTGYRYTTSDNTQHLKPYTTGNLDASQSFALKQVRLKIYARLCNIWNEQYQIMAYRPMPMFNFHFGLAVYFLQPNKIKTKIHK